MYEPWRDCWRVAEYFIFSNYDSCSIVFYPGNQLIWLRKDLFIASTILNIKSVLQELVDDIFINKNLFVQSLIRIECILITKSNLIH